MGALAKHALVVTVVLTTAQLVTSCGGSGEQAVDDALPAYCATRGGTDEQFWRTVERTCRRATDGDRAKARVLREVLQDASAEQVADFHRAFHRASRALAAPPVRRAADDACLPGLGLGDDLFTDFRSWLIAHGQVAVEAVIEDPGLIAELPDLEAGCGRGEPYGAAAVEVYLDKTGLTARQADLPALEDIG